MKDRITLKQFNQLSIEGRQLAYLHPMFDGRLPFKNELASLLRAHGRSIPVEVLKSNGIKILWSMTVELIEERVSIGKKLEIEVIMQRLKS